MRKNKNYFYATLVIHLTLCFNFCAYASDADVLKAYEKMKTNISYQGAFTEAVKELNGDAYPILHNLFINSEPGYRPIILRSYFEGGVSCLESEGDILKSFEDPDWQIRNIAVVYTGFMDCKKFKPSVLKLLKSESNLQVKTQILSILGIIGGADEVELLKNYQNDENQDTFTRLAALGSMAKLGGDFDSGFLNTALDSSDITTKLHSIQACRFVREKIFIQKLRNLGNENPFYKSEANISIHAIKVNNLSSSEKEKALFSYIETEEKAVKDWAVHSLINNFNSQAVKGHLLKLSESENNEVAESVIKGLYENKIIDKKQVEDIYMKRRK